MGRRTTAVIIVVLCCTLPALTVAAVSHSTYSERGSDDVGLLFLETEAKWLYFQRNKGASQRHNEIVKHHRITEDTLWQRQLSYGRLNDTASIPYLNYITDRLVKEVGNASDTKAQNVFAVQEEAGATGDDVWYWVDDTSKAIEALSTSPSLFKRYRVVIEGLVEFLLSPRTSCPEAPSLLFRRHVADRLWLDSEPGDVSHVRAHSAFMDVRAELPFGRIWHHSRYHGVEQPSTHCLKPFQIRFVHQGNLTVVDVDVDTLSSIHDQEPSEELSRIVIAAAVNKHRGPEGETRDFGISLSYLIALTAKGQLVGTVNVSYHFTEGHPDTLVTIHAQAEPGEYLQDVEIVLQLDLSHRKSTEYTRLYSLMGDVHWGDTGGGCSRAHNLSLTHTSIPELILPEVTDSKVLHYQDRTLHDNHRFLRWMALSQQPETDTGGLTGVHSLFTVYHDPMKVKAVSYSAEPGKRSSSRDPKPPVRILSLKSLFILGNVSSPPNKTTNDSNSTAEGERILGHTAFSLLSVHGTLTSRMQQYNRVLSDLVRCRGSNPLPRQNPHRNEQSSGASESVAEAEARSQTGPICSCSCVARGKDYSLSTNYGVVLNALAVYIKRVGSHLNITNGEFPSGSLPFRALRWIQDRLTLFKEDFLTMRQEDDNMDEQEDESETVQYSYDRELYKELHHLERATLLMPYISLAFSAIACGQLFKATKDTQYAHLLADDLLPLLLQRVGRGRGMTLGAVDRERTTIGAQAAGMLALAAAYDVVASRRKEVFNKMRDTVQYLRREYDFPLLPKDESSHAKVRIRIKGGYETQNYYWAHKAGLLLRALTRYRRLELRISEPVYWTHEEVQKMDSIAKVLTEYLRQCTVTVNTTVTSHGLLTITTRHTYYSRTGSATGAETIRSYRDVDPQELRLYSSSAADRHGGAVSSRSTNAHYFKRIQTHAGHGSGRSNAETQAWGTIGLMFQPWL